MESNLELLVVFSRDLDEEIFQEILTYAKKQPFFISAIYSANRVYFSFSGDKELSEELLDFIGSLGLFLREYRLGIRDFYLPSYEISFPCEYTGKMKIPLVDSVIFNGENCKLHFKDIEKEEIRKELIEKSIALIQSKLFKKETKVIHPNSEFEKRTELSNQIKKENMYEEENIKALSALKDKLSYGMKEFFGSTEVFTSSEVPLFLIEKEGLSENLPKETLSKFIFEPKNKEELYEYYYLTQKIKNSEFENKGILFDDIPINLYHGLEGSKSRKIFLHYQNGFEIGILFLESEELYESVKEKLIEFFKDFLDSIKCNYQIVLKKIKGKDFFAFEVISKTGKRVTLIELLFSENIYTEIFKIKSWSGQGKINLRYLFNCY